MYRYRTLIIAAVCGLLLVACGQGGDTAAAPTTAPPPTTATTPTTAPAPTTAGPAATPTNDATTAAPDPTGTSPTGATTTPAPSEVASGAAEVLAFFVRSGESGEWIEPEVIMLAEPTAGVARAAVEAMVAGETRDPGRMTLVPEGTTVLGVNIDGTTLVVDLSGGIRDANLGSAGEIALSQQLAHTGAQFDTVDDVRLLVDGAAVTDLYGHLDWSQPIAPDRFALSPITFDTHTWGEQVPVGQVTVGGEANTFEANVPLRLVDPDGTVVEETFTTATSGSGERGRWESTFDLTGPGTWTIEATEDDPSDGEGRPPFATTLELQVG